MRLARAATRVFAGTWCIVVAGGCGGNPPVPQGPRLTSSRELSPAERQFGQSPHQAPGVSYQPDVVVFEKGADAIRGVSGNGLSWTVNASAAGVDQIQPGRVVMLTSRAVGRVLAVDKGSDGLHVILGPVEITDVVKEGSFALDQPLNLDDAVKFTAPEYPGTISPVTPIAARPTDSNYLVRRVLDQNDAPLALTRFKVTPLVGSAGIGVRVTSNQDGLVFMGEVVLYLNAPRLRFNLDIEGGKIVVCEVELTGAAGLLQTFEAGSERGYSANINERVEIPIDFGIPISGMGVPFAVNVRQTFILKTAFSAKNGTLRARGNYNLSGGLSIGFRDGKFSAGAPTGLTTKESLLRSANGVSFGPMGLVMVHQAKVIVGIGAFGFATGPYVALNSSVAVSHGSSIGLVVCKGATLSMALDGGVGYAMPQGVTRAINSILRALNINHEVHGSGGFSMTTQRLLNTTSVSPKVPLCGQDSTQ